MVERINSNELEAFIENGIPLERLTQRLKPTSSNDRLVDKTLHDNWSDFSQVGFIGENEDLITLIKNDLQIVSKNNTNYKRIARAVRLSIPKYNSFTMQTTKSNLNLNPEYEFISTSIITMGNQSCPWDCNERGQNVGLIVKKEISHIEKELIQVLTSGIPSEIVKQYLTNDLDTERRNTNLQLISSIQEKQKEKPYYAMITGLLPHMIEAHYFFEGKDSPYRADPQVLIDAFMLKGKK